MQKLFLFVGYPGAGKTTVAQKLSEQTNAVHIWADHERQKMFSQPKHSKQEHGALYDYLNDKTDRLLAQGQSVIFDTNFNFKKDRNYLKSIAAKYQARTIIIWVTTPKELARQRAVKDSHGKETRLYGNMPLKDFERIAGNLQLPDKSENFIKIDGTKLADSDIARILEA